MTDTAIILATSRGIQRTLTDGTVRLSIDVEPSDAITAMQLFGVPGSHIAIAKINDDAAKDHTVGKAIEKSPYGAEARELKLSSFCRTPDVWRAVGSDDDFLAYLRLQECYSCPQTHGIEAAHVRSVANGSGTSIKPDYSAIPLCSKCHNIIQHDQGICRLTEKERISDARDVLQAWRIQALESWVWNTVKKQLGCESFALLPPSELLFWAQKRCVEQFLPKCYREAL